MFCRIAHDPTNLKPPLWGLYLQKCETSLKYEKLGWFWLVLVLEYFMHWRFNIEKKINISICNIDVGSEYFAIIWDNCITKVQIKVYDTVYDNNSPGVIYGCAFPGRVKDEDGCGKTFVRFVVDKVVKDYGLQVSDGNGMINSIGCQNLCVVSSINFKLRCTVLLQ